MGNYSRIKRIGNSSTGEVITEVQNFSVRRDPQNYFILFCDNLNDVLANITSVVEIKVLLALCSSAAFNNNVIVVNKAVKQKIAEQIQSSEGSVRNALSMLCKMGYIENKNGSYSISPYLFWKGYTNERQKLVQARDKQLLKNSADNFLNENKQSDSAQEGALS